jgi:hypothetical protein
VPLLGRWAGSPHGCENVAECGANKTARNSKETPATSLFLGREMRYSYPIGWLYPIFAGFRILAGAAKENGDVIWKRDPIKFWERHGQELVRRYEPHLASMGNETRKVATDPLCYQAMRTAVTDCTRTSCSQKRESRSKFRRC